MVERRKAGLNMYYAIADPGIFEVCDLACSTLEDEVESSRRALRGR